MAAGAYRWWYLDAIADDGRHALTLIAFVGSVFSPYYRLARQRHGPTAEADAHCALNVCLYDLQGGGTSRWTMTERGASQVRRSSREFVIGPSALQWDGQTLSVEIDERGAPLPRRVRGHVKLHPLGLARWSTALDADGRHRWGPIAPCARVEVQLRDPAITWQGNAYLDSNEGDEPIEGGFRRWDWQRAALPDGRCAVVYHAERSKAGEGLQALLFDRHARATDVIPLQRPVSHELPATRWWRVPRTAHGDAGPRADAPRLVRTLEDTPFYSRSLVELGIAGQRTLAVHESLDVARLVAPWVQALLPFRMPRRG